MTDIEQLKCENCGAPLNKDLTCSYCGARYRRKDGPAPIFVQTCPARIHTLEASVAMDDYMIRDMGPDEASKFAVDCLEKEIAKGLTKHMEIRTNDDFMHFRQIVRGRVRVVDPDFRF